MVLIYIFKVELSTEVGKEKVNIYSENVCIAKCLNPYCKPNLLKPAGYVTHQQVKHSTTVHSIHTVFMCFVFI